MSSMTLLRAIAIPALGLAAGCSSAPTVYKEPVGWICTITWNKNAPAHLKDITKAMAKARSKKEAEDNVMARGDAGQKEKVECISSVL